MANLMILPNETMLKIMEYLLQNPKIYFSNSRQSRTIAQTPLRPNILRITAVNSRLRELSWSYLKRHGRFTAVYLDSLLHKFNRFTTFEHIECLYAIPDQFKHFSRPDRHNPAPILSPFPNLKQVAIWLHNDYQTGKAWSLRAREGETKSETFVRHMITKTMGGHLAELLSFLHSPSRAVDVVVEIDCTRLGQPVSRLHFPLASQR